MSKLVMHLFTLKEYEMNHLRLTVLVGLLFLIISAALVSASVSLTPTPKSLKELGGAISLASTDRITIVVGKKASEPETFAAERLQTLVKQRFNVSAEIVGENNIPTGSALYVYIGQKATNGTLARLCDKHNLAVKQDGLKPGNDAFALEVLPNEKSALVLGSNPRSVIFGIQTLFKLISASSTIDHQPLTIPAVSIHDWPSIAWRGGDAVNTATPDEYDAELWSGFNFMRAAYPRDGKWEIVRSGIAEAHKRGFFVYAYRTTAVKQTEVEKVMSDFQKFIDAGADGLWMSFDDYGPGETTIPLMERIIELGKQHGMTGRKIAITPPYPDYNTVDTPFDRERAKIKGMEKALWFFTTVPSAGNKDTARRIGIKTPPAWWHNWPRVEGGFSHGGYGYRSMRPDGKTPYMEIPPLVWGWHNPGYGDIWQAEYYTDTVLPCRVPGPSLYTLAPLGIWAWNDGPHDFVKTREEIYDTVYGPKCVPLMMRFDDTHHLLREFFTIASNAGGLPNKFPPRLRTIADRGSCKKLIETLESLTVEINRLAPQGSVLTPENLEATYLEPMRADTKIIRALFESDFPENWWWEQEAQILQLASTGQTDKAIALGKMNAPKLNAQLDTLDKNLSPVLNMTGYIEFWRKRATACQLGEPNELAALFNEQPGGVYKESDTVKKFKAATDSPQPGTMLAQATPEQLIQTVSNKGPWIPALYTDKDITAVQMAFPGQRNSNMGDFCQVSFKVEIPIKTGRRVVRFKMYCEPFVRMRDGYNGRAGMRSIQLLIGNKVIWQEDAITAYDRPELWRTVDITDIPDHRSAISTLRSEITLRVIDNAAFQAGVHITSPGGSDESRGNGFADPTSYQTYLLVGPIQIWSVD